MTVSGAAFQKENTYDIVSYVITSDLSIVCFALCLGER